MKTAKSYAWPYAIFQSSRTPPGLYARQKWLQESSNPLWRADFDVTVADLYRGRSDDGLWDGSSIETIQRLFGLHLTVRTSNPSIERSLDALMRVVHPDYATHTATGLLVAWLADRQTNRGDWGPDIPFYQTLNALAHLDTAAANRQCDQAFDDLLSRQDADGAWGRSDRQWCTFLAVHALHNKGLI